MNKEKDEYVLNLNVEETRSVSFLTSLQLWSPGPHTSWVQIEKEVVCHRSKQCIKTQKKQGMLWSPYQESIHPYLRWETLVLEGCCPASGELEKKNKYNMGPLKTRIAQPCYALNPTLRGVTLISCSYYPLQYCWVADYIISTS